LVACVASAAYIGFSLQQVLMALWTFFRMIPDGTILVLIWIGKIGLALVEPIVHLVMTVSYVLGYPVIRFVTHLRGEAGSLPWGTRQSEGRIDS
jgi:hypothetical protein